MIGDDYPNSLSPTLNDPITLGEAVCLCVFIAVIASIIILIP